MPSLTRSALRSSLSGLSTRVANLESERRHLRKTVDALRDELITLTANIDTFEVRPFILMCFRARQLTSAPLPVAQNRETDILDEVLAIVSNSPRLPPVAAAAGKPALPAPSSLAKRMQTKAAQSSWGQLGLLGLAQGGLIAVYVWSVRGRRRGKDLKTN